MAYFNSLFSKSTYYYVTLCPYKIIFLKDNLIEKMIKFSDMSLFRNVSKNVGDFNTENEIGSSQSWNIGLSV